MNSGTENETNLIALLGAEREITCLISTYSYLLDGGKFDEVAELLQHATLEVPGASVDGQAAIEQFLASGVQRHGDGTPRTWHSASSLLVDVDLEQNSATSTRYFTVHQELPGFPLRRRACIEAESAALT